MATRVLTAPPLHDPAWRARAGWTLAALAVLVPTGWLAEFNPATLWGGASLRATGQLLATFYPPRVDPAFLLEVAVATWQTIAIATVGTTLAVLIAVPLALVANRTLSISAFAGGRMCALCGAVRTGIRWVLIVLRSIPEIVWALLFVRAVGLGDTAGVMAIALTYGGMLGKVYIEIFESNEAQGTRALLANGASRTQAFAYGTLPTCLPDLLSYTIYRWELSLIHI